MNDKYTIALPVFDEWLSSVVAPSGPALGDLALREVSPESRLSERQALEQFARYFKSEMHYDNVQYHANEHDSNCAGFLFTSSALDMCSGQLIPDSILRFSSAATGEMPSLNVCGRCRL